MILDAVFVLDAALQTKFLFPNKYLRNFESMPKMSTHVLLTSKKHRAWFLVKSLGKCWESTAFAFTCYSRSSRCFPIQTLVPVSAELNHNGSS